MIVRCAYRLSRLITAFTLLFTVAEMGACSKSSERPAQSGGTATTTATNSPAITGNGNVVTYNPPVQPVQPPPKPKPKETVPCPNALKFKQEESEDYLGFISFHQRITIYPRHFKPDTVLPVVVFIGTKKITGGFAQGIMTSPNVGDPLAAGISVASGRGGIITRDHNTAELWLSDVEKFENAKAVVVRLNSTERFKLVCVQQPPIPPTQMISIPNAH